MINCNGINAMLLPYSTETIVPEDAEVNTYGSITLVPISLCDK